MQYNRAFISRFNQSKSCRRARCATFLVIVVYKENRWVFSFDLNWATDGHWRTETGRLFHSIGPANEKARLPNFRFVRITAKSPRVDERSPLDLEAEPHGVAMDDMYDGEVPEWM